MRVQRGDIALLAARLLVQWAGRAVALPAMIDASDDRVESDDLVAPPFPDGVSRGTASA